MRSKLLLALGGVAISIANSACKASSISDTDLLLLDTNDSHSDPRFMLLGPALLKGNGTFRSYDLGAKAIHESLAEIIAITSAYDEVIIFAAFKGGVGGAAAYLAGQLDGASTRVSLFHMMELPFESKLPLDDPRYKALEQCRRMLDRCSLFHAEEHCIESAPELYVHMAEIRKRVIQALIAFLSETAPRASVSTGHSESEYQIDWTEDDFGSSMLHDLVTRWLCKVDPANVPKGNQFRTGLQAIDTLVGPLKEQCVLAISCDDVSLSASLTGLAVAEIVRDTNFAVAVITHSLEMDVFVQSTLLSIAELTEINIDDVAQNAAIFDKLEQASATLCESHVFIFERRPTRLEEATAFLGNALSIRSSRYALIVIDADSLSGTYGDAVRYARYLSDYFHCNALLITGKCEAVELSETGDSSQSPDLCIRLDTSSSKLSGAKSNVPVLVTANDCSGSKIAFLNYNLNSKTLSDF